jgi:hypothetical protein
MRFPGCSRKELSDRGTPRQGVMPSVRDYAWGTQLGAGLLPYAGCENIGLDLERGAGFAEVVHPGQELNELARALVRLPGDTAHKAFHRLGDVLVPKDARNLRRVDHVAEEEMRQRCYGATVGGVGFRPQQTQHGIHLVDTNAGTLGENLNMAGT